MRVTAGDHTPDRKRGPKMINLMTFLNSLTRIEVALTNVDKAIRAIGERANRRARNQRWMNG
jgi:hypothetical protein